MIRRPPRSTLFPTRRSSDLLSPAGALLAGLAFALSGYVVSLTENIQYLYSICMRSEEHTSELQSQSNLVCRLLLEKKKTHIINTSNQTPPVGYYPRVLLDSS